MPIRTSFVATLLGLAATSVAPAASFSFNSSNDGFTSSFNTAPFDGPWVYAASGGAGGTGAWSTEGQAPEIQHPTTTDLTSPGLVVSATGNVVLDFDHRWSFEFDGTTWDGGAVFLAVNGGSFTMVPGGSFTAVGYNGSVAGNSGSQLAGQTAFISASTDYALGTFVHSTANLGSFAAGTTLAVRFRAAGDTNTSGGSPDWVVDNVNISNTSVIPEPGSAGLLFLGFAGMAARRRKT